MNKGIHMHGGTLSDCIQAFLRSSGYSQKELAAVLGLYTGTGSPFHHFW